MSVRLPQSEIIPNKNDVGALGNRINQETKVLHDQINKLVTLKFALAIRDPKIYRQGLQLYYHIFSAVEESLKFEIQNPNSKYSSMLNEIFMPVILREEPLYQDLMFYYNDRPEKFSTPILPLQIELVDHIKKVTKEKPYLLLAYMHVLYLALFAGGRLLKSQIVRSLRLFPQIKGKNHQDIIEMATNFYKFDFEDDESLRIVYKRNYELQTRNFLTEEEKQDVINESKFLFDINAKCIKEIENHNINRLKSKLSYQFFTKGYYVLIALSVLIILNILRRLVLWVL